MKKNNIGVMLNAYPDSMGKKLSYAVDLLSRPEVAGAFRSFYILPSIFNTDLDRGFSIIDYGLDEMLAAREDIDKLHHLDIDLALDFVLNHASVLSKQFQDIVKNGEDSKYKDFFINWNRFWDGHGEMTEEGYIQPDPELIKNMFFRKPGLPILMVRFPDGCDVPYWNTFYQKITYLPVTAEELMEHAGLQYSIATYICACVNKYLDDGLTPKQMHFGDWDKYREPVVNYLESRRSYLGQMDLNIKSPLVWEYYQETLKTLSDYGASIVRLDAFAYAPKEVGEKNFLNDPGTWDLLDRIAKIAEPHGLTLLPEIHASYGEGIYKLLASKGYMVYDFFLPGLLIDAFERKNGTILKRWVDEIVENNIHTVNMLGCHDGIPLLDLKGLLDDESIRNLIDTVVGRGGHVKDLHGQKNVYYQVNATYYSALGEDDRKMLLARALQMFMPGKPQVWYLDLFAGKNDYEAMRAAGKDGHKEINRTNLSEKTIYELLTKDVVKKQLVLLKMRNEFEVFCEEAVITSAIQDSLMTISWKTETQVAELKVDFVAYTYEIIIRDLSTDRVLFQVM